MIEIYFCSLKSSDDKLIVLLKLVSSLFVVSVAPTVIFLFDSTNGRMLHSVSNLAMNNQNA